MDLLLNLGLGAETALTPVNILYCFVGVLLGTLIGVLPGVGPIATIAMLLPITFGLDPTGALIMLAGIYYGAQYGGSTTSILVAGAASPETRWRELAVFAVAVTAGCIGLFRTLLHLPIPIFVIQGWVVL